MPDINVTITQFSINAAIQTTAINVSMLQQGPQGDQGDPGEQGPPGENGANGVGVPAGGGTGQRLSKASNADFDTEWIDPFQYGNYHMEPGEIDDGDISGDHTVQFDQASSHRLNLTGDANIVFVNPQNAAPYVLRIIQGSGGNHAITWPAEVDWGVDGPPTLSTDEGKQDLINLYYVAGKYLGSFKLGYDE